MAGEREWVEAIKKRIWPELPTNMVVRTGHRLPYAVYVSGYSEESEPVIDEPSKYQTDLLILESCDGSSHWVPRVVVEFKLGRVTTHDALTYSAKAATHKSIHPYLRYGIVIGHYSGAVPRRLIRHGHQFDFMLTLASHQLSNADRDKLCKLVREEVVASQQIGQVLSGASAVTLLHRKMSMSA